MQQNITALRAAAIGTPWRFAPHEGAGTIDAPNSWIMLERRPCMPNAQYVTLNSPTREDDSAKHTLQRNLRLISRHPIALICAAGALGYVLSRVLVTGGAAAQLASPRRRQALAGGPRSASLWPAGGLPKAHGDKLASAARVAATRTYAPTYPEG